MTEYIDVDLNDLGVDPNLRQYILDGHEPVEEPDPLTWGRWMKTHKRHVAQHRSDDGWLVSTLFIGLDMRLFEFKDNHLPPLLFETMTFAPSKSIASQERCSTWAMAERQHAAACATLREADVVLREVTR